jgi:hypothetical protein
MSTAGLEPGHEHDLPAALVQRVRLLTRALVVFGVCLLGIGTLLVLIILERGAQRDREQAELEQSIRNSWCLALDTLPEGGLLDLLRVKYGCGPGTPISQLPRDIQDQLADRTPRIKRPDPEPADARPPVPVPSPNFAGGVMASEPGTNPESVPPNPGTSPAPPPPLVDLGPVTDLCEATGVCG